MHLHQSIVDAKGNNIFSNEDGSESELFYHFIGGLQAYLPDMMLVFAPFVNSYRRFIKGSMAPVNLLWGHDNRTTGLRIPRSGPAARRVETRVAGADANPYLVIAATLAAGLAGMEEKLEPTTALEGSAYDHSHDLARTFLVAHQQFEASASARKLLGNRFVTAFASVKEIEYQNYLSEVGAWERRFLLPLA
jgi:glutamine synthetase